MLRADRAAEYRTMLAAEPGLTRAGLARRVRVSRAWITRVLGPPCGAVGVSRVWVCRVLSHGGRAHGSPSSARTRTHQSYEIQTPCAS